MEAEACPLSTNIALTPRPPDIDAARVRSSASTGAGYVFEQATRDLTSNRASGGYGRRRNDRQEGRRRPRPHTCRVVDHDGLPAFNTSGSNNYARSVTTPAAPGARCWSGRPTRSTPTMYPNLPAPAGGHSGQGIFEHRRLARLDAQQLHRGQVGIWGRLARKMLSSVMTPSMRLEQVCDTCGAEYLGAVGAGGHHRNLDSAGRRTFNRWKHRGRISNLPYPYRCPWDTCNPHPSTAHTRNSCRGWRGRPGRRRGPGRSRAPPRPARPLDR